MWVLVVVWCCPDELTGGRGQHHGGQQQEWNIDGGQQQEQGIDGELVHVNYILVAKYDVNNYDSGLKLHFYLFYETLK